MKILMLGWELPPYNSGGLGVACYELAKALAGHGAEIDFVLPAEAQHDNPEFMHVMNALPCESLPDAREVDLATALASKDPYTHSYDAVRRTQEHYKLFVEQYIAEHKPHVIHANDWLTLEAGAHAKNICGAPLIAQVHATEFDRAGGKRGNPLIHEIEQHGLLAADHIVAVSKATKRIIMREYGIPADKIEVIHNSHNKLPPHSTELMEYRYIEMLKNEGYTVVATIGRLTIQKGLSHFLRAAAKAYSRHSRMVFVLAGNGDQRDELIRLSADLGISDAVLFPGFVRGKAWRDMYNLADVFVMSSVSEPFGLTALEAAQHNTAISLTNQSGVSEVLQNVLRYDYWDEDRLADQLIALTSSNALKDELARNAALEVAGMSWASVAKQFMHKYTMAVEGVRR